MPAPDPATRHSLPTPSPRRDIDFRAYSSAELSTLDVDQLARFLAAAFTRWPGRQRDVAALDHLRWKLAGANGGAAAILGRCGDELAVAQTLWQQPALFHGRECKRIVFNDLAVAPRHRGTGLSSLENRFKDRYFEGDVYVNIGVTREPALRRQWQGRGLRPLGSPVAQLVRPLAGTSLGPTPVYGSRLRDAVAVSFLELSRKLRSLAGGATVTARPAVEIRTITRFDRAADDLFERVAHEFDFIGLRDARYLNWRYLDRRAGEFFVRAVWEQSSRLLGYAIVTPTAPWAALADLIVEPGRADIATALVCDAVEACRQRAGVVALECWLPARHPYMSVVRGQFGVAGRDVGLGHRLVGLDAEGSRSLADPDATLHFMLGDTDFV